MAKSHRLNITVSEGIDRELRIFLAAHDGKKGDISKFVEEAVRLHIQGRNKTDAKERTASRMQLM